MSSCLFPGPSLGVQESDKSNIFEKSILHYPSYFGGKMFFTLILGGSGRLLAFFAGGQGKNSKKSATCTTGFCVH